MFNILIIKIFNKKRRVKLISASIEKLKKFVLIMSSYSHGQHNNMVYLHENI